MTRGIVALAICAWSAATTLGQSTGALSGVVVIDEQSGRPVRQAIVSLGGLPQRVSTVTDDRGQFSFPNLPAGRFTLTASKPAHLTTAYGARRPGRPGTPIALAAGQRIADVRLTLPRGAVITGVVSDRAGEPLRDLSVTVVSVTALTATQAGVMLRPEPVLTDDRGVYRAFGLAPGEYVVCASARLVGRGDVGLMTAADIDAAFSQLKLGPSRPGQSPATAGAVDGDARVPGGRGLTLVPTFYPGTSRALDAERITVSAGEERGGISFALDLVRSALVEGIVSSPDGSPVQSIGLSLDPDGPRVDIPFGTMPVPTPPDGSGRFSFRGVTPGIYTLTARSGARGRGAAETGVPLAPMWARTRVAVDGADVRGLALALRPTLRFAGRLTFDASSPTPPANLTQMRVVLTPESGASLDSMTGANMTTGAAGLVNADGSFLLTGLLPGRYTIQVLSGAGGPGWTLRSAILGERDLVDAGVDVGEEDVAGVAVTMTDRLTELTGSLQTAGGAPAPEFVVVAFPADKSLWLPNSRRIKFTRPATDGRYLIRDLPGGNYLIVVATDVDPEDLRDPAFLAQLAAGAVRITLADGERKAQDLRIAR
jgi:hypothetical protein